MNAPRLSSALVRELMANGTLHHVAEHLALDLLEERERHATLRARCIERMRDLKAKIEAIPLEDVPDV